MLWVVFEPIHYPLWVEVWSKGHDASAHGCGRGRDHGHGRVGALWSPFHAHDGDPLEKKHQHF